MHHEAHERDHDQHAHGELVDPHAHGEAEGAEREVVELPEVRQLGAAGAEDGPREEPDREGQADEDGADRYEVAVPGQPPADRQLDHEGGERQAEDQAEIAEHRPPS